MRATALLLASLLLLGGCTVRQPQGAQHAHVPLQDILETALWLQPDADPQTLIARLGTPGSSSLESLDTPHAATGGQLRTLHYDGLSLTLYESDGVSFITDLSVSSAHYNSPEGLSVGKSRDAVEDLIGIPLDGDASFALYERYDAGAPYTLELSFEGETVSRLHWRFYWE